MEMDFLFQERNILYNILCFLIAENEKVFNRSDTKLYWRTVLHIVYVLHHAYIGIFGLSIKDKLQYNENENLRILYTFQSGFFTGWNFVAQTAFLFLALSHDVLEWTDKENSNIGSKIRYYRDVLFCGFVVPYTCFVFSMFWVLYTIDRELVFPAVYDDVIPWWFNHCVHTNILVLVLAENLLQARRKPTEQKWELIINATVGISYAIVYYAIYFSTGRWLYNVFALMNWWQVCLFQVLIWFSTYVFYIMQFPLNRLIHGPDPEFEKTNEKSQINDSNGDIKEVNEKNAESTIENDEVIIKNGEYGTKNCGFATKNGKFGSENEGFVTENEEVDKEMEGDNIDSKLPFSSKSWSLKYRNMRNQAENTNL